MKARRYDLYGSKRQDIQELRGMLEKKLGVSFEARESGYMGGEYFRSGALGSEEFVLRRNVDASTPDLEVVYEEFSDYPVILEVNATDRADELSQILTSMPDLESLRAIEA